MHNDFIFRSSAVTETETPWWEMLLSLQSELGMSVFIHCPGTDTYQWGWSCTENIWVSWNNTWDDMEAVYVQISRSVVQLLIWDSQFFYLKGPLPVAKPLGISNNRLNNRYITASSIWDKYHAAWLARLYNKKRGRYIGGWSSKVNRRGQWIQYDLRRPKKIVKVATQGRQDLNQYVTRYIIKYSADAFHWTPYRKYSRVQV